MKNPPKNPFSAFVRSVLQWFRSYRIRREPSRFPSRANPSRAREQAVNELRAMLFEVLSDPATARTLARHLLGPVLPIVGGMPTGIQDRIAKFNTAGDDVVNTVAPIFEDSTGKVGIGTTTLSHALEVNGNIRLQGGAREFRINTTGAEFVAFDASDTTSTPAMRLYGGKLVILNSGNVGIGTPGPGYKLVVEGDLAVTGIIRGQFASGQGDVLYVGNDGKLVDINVANTVGLYGLTDATVGSLKLGSGGGTLSGYNGNVGIGTTSPPTEKLDVAGQMKCDKLNKIVFLRAVGGSHDDGADINTAISNLPDNGGIIYLVPGTTYNIKTTIRNGSKKSVKLRGFGGAAIDGEVGPTILKWDTTSSESSKRVIELKSNTSGEHWDDFEISDVTIDGNNNALTGVYLNAIASSKFVNVQIQNMNKRTSDGQTASIGFELTTSQDGRNTMFNMFLNCSVWGADIGLKLTGGTTNDTANSCHNTFVGLNIGYYAKISSGTPSNAGILLGDCDNNCIIRPWIFPIPVDGVTAAPGVLIEKASGSQAARANYFYHLQPAGASGENPPNIAFWLKLAATNYSGSKNLVFGYDRENGQLQPRAWDTSGNEFTTPGDIENSLFWIEPRGDIYGGQIANL